MNTAGQRRLVNLYMTDCIHQQIGQVIGCITALSCNAAYAHIYEWLVSCKELGTALAGDPHHLRHLDQHTACKLKCLEVIHSAGLNVCLVERVHILVYTADGHTSLILFHNKQGLDGPYCLDCLPEGLRLVSRNLCINLGDLVKLCLSLWIGLFVSQFLCIFGHSSGIDHYAFGCLDNGLVEVDLLNIIWILVVKLC